MSQPSKTQQSKKPSPQVSAKDSRASIIDTVQTPLGFFVLVVLIVEAIFGLIASFGSGFDKTFVIIGMLVLILLLVLIVAGMALFHPMALYGVPKEANNSVSALQPPLPEIETVKRPKILYASSYLHEGMSEVLQQEIQVLKKDFPGLVVVKTNLIADEFRELLIHNKFEIVHLTVNVTSEGGLEFRRGDLVPCEGLVQLLEISNTKLLVLACCNSVPLAAKLAMRVNMIAAAGNVEVRAFDKWEKIFYHLLAEETSLSKAYEVATSSVQVGYQVEGAPLSIVMVMKQDVVFKK